MTSLIQWPRNAVAAAAIILTVGTVAIAAENESVIARGGRLYD